MTFTFCNQDYLQITPRELILDTDSASAGSVHISSDMSWTISGGCEWLSISTFADSGSVYLQVVALSENTAFEGRTCTFTVTASNGMEQTITVTQRGQEPYIIAEVTEPVTTNNVGIFYHENSTCSIEIHSNCAWTISANAEWIGFSQTEGSGIAYLTATALTENTTCLPRHALITVSNEYGQNVFLSVMQYNFYHGTLSITPSTLTIDNYMDVTEVLMVTATDSWSVLNSPSWLSVTPESGGAYDNSLTLTVTGANYSANPRTGTIVVSDVCGRTDSQVQITVTQPEGYIILSEQTVAMDAQQGSEAAISVECCGAWTAVSGTIPEWLSVSPTNAVGNALVTLTTLSENPENTERTAVLRFRCTMSLYTELLVTQQAGTGIMEMEEVSANLYPNPVADVLTLDLGGSFLYTVYDASGRMVMRGQLSANDNVLSVSNLESGIYYIRFNEEQTGKTTVAKFVKR